MQFIECEKLKYLSGENAKYTRQRVIQEFLRTLGSQIEERPSGIKKKVHCFLLIDESTDVAVLNEMVVYIRYITPNAEVKTLFMKILELFNGIAQGIEEAVVNYLDNKNLPFSGFATDGARVMTGRLNGVAARLKQRKPVLTSVHCVAHRLALASQSGSQVAYINNTFKPTLTQPFCFYENSPVRMSGLKAIEQLLKTPELKLKRAADTHWLSHDGACQTLMKVLPAVMTSLE